MDGITGIGHCTRKSYSPSSHPPIGSIIERSSFFAPLIKSISMRKRVIEMMNV